MRFRKRVKVFPGFYLNFSGSSMSSTLGVRGASINIGKKGTYLNTGIPGTGLYDRQKIRGSDSSSNLLSNVDINIDQVNSIEPQEKIGEIRSVEVEKLTSTNLIDLKETLLEAYNDKRELLKDLEQTKNNLKTANAIYLISCILIFGLVIKHFKNKIQETKDYLADLEEQIENCLIDIDVHFEKQFEDLYNKLVVGYQLLMTCDKIWDVTTSVDQNAQVTRSAASAIISRSQIKIKFDNIDIIKSSYPAFHFENKNGGDLYIYPAFVIITNSNSDFGLIDIKEFDLKFSTVKFLEENEIPKDSVVIDKTWAKVNKNGQQDKRFKDNYEIPIVRYGEYEFKSKTGLNETYSFSSFEKSQVFAQAFEDYQNVL